MNGRYHHEKVNKSKRGVIFVIVLIVILLAGWGLYTLLTPPKQLPMESIKDEATKVAFISVVVPEKKDS